MQNVKQCIHAEQARWRVWFWAACELFVLFSMMRFLRIGPLYAASGVLFPLPVAIAVNLAGTAVMVSLPFWLGKKLGSQAVQYILRRWPKSAMLRELRGGSDFFFVLIVRLLGFLTTCVLFPIMGMSLSDIRSPQFLTAAGIQLAAMLASCIAFHFYRKKHIKQPMDFIKGRTAEQ